MNTIMHFVLIAILSGTSGWRVMGTLPGNEGFPRGMSCNGNDGTVTVFMEEPRGDSVIHRVVVMNSDGTISESSEEAFQAEQDSSVRFAAAVPETGGRLGVCCISPFGDTLWKTELDSVVWGQGCSGRVLPAWEGGCFSVFTPGPGSDIWHLYRIGSGGEVLSRCVFQLPGGPVLGLKDMAETPDGGVLLTGVTDSLGMNLSMFLLGFDSDCREMFGISDSLRFHASGDLLMVSDSGEIYLAGNTGYERDDGYFLPPVDKDVFLMKFSSSGEELWRSIFPLPLQNVPLCICTAGDGGVFMITSSSQEDGSRPGGSPYSICTYAP